MVTAVNSPVSGEIGMPVTLQCTLALPNGITNTQLSDTSYYIEWIYNGKNYSIIVKDFTRSITNQISQYSNL